jgi:microsomal dipeptidase-like Zn-dependent dipeptidase
MRPAWRRIARGTAWSLGGLVVVGAAGFFALVPAHVERALNRVAVRPQYRPSERGRALHQRLLIVDLHADTLLWGRDVLERSTRGHVDVPRLVEGNVAIQAFTVVTKVPRGQNIERNDDRSDPLFFLALAQRWPPRTWRSLKERALHQAERLHDAAARSGGRLVVLRRAADLEAFLDRRQRERGTVAGLLGIEGAHALDGDPANVDTLYDMGFRMIAPTHFFDNDIGGSAHGVLKGGLTAKGREMVRRMEAQGMLVDLAHASPRTFQDVLALVTRPVVVSHTGVRGTCDNVRNLSDDQVRAVARTGGVVGIGYWSTAVCGADGAAVARAVRHVASVAGIDHVALGSDFDGAITAPFDTTGLVEVTDALLAQGFSEEDVAKVMGGNALRLLLAALPP